MLPQRLGLAVILTAALLTPAAGQQEFDPFSPLALALSPDGRLLARTELSRRGLPGTETTVTDTRTGKERFRVRSPNRTLYGLAFSPDSRLLALAGGDNVQTGVWHGEVKVVRADSGRPLFSHTVKNGILRYLAFTADSKHFVTRTSDNPFLPPEALILEVATGTVKKTWQPGDRPFGGRPLSSYWLPVPHPDGRLLIERGSGNKVYEAGKGQKVYEVKLRRGTGLHSVVFSPDGRRLALVELTLSLGPGPSRIDDPGVVHVCDTASGRVLDTLEGHRRQILCAAFSPDGRRLITGSMDHTARVWDADSGKLLGTLRRPRARVLAVAFTPGGRLALAADADGKLHVWDRGVAP
jgi:WD40 repeat protein